MADWITILHRIRLRVRSVLLRDLVEREMDAEMRHHLDRATERLMGRGIPRREARAMAHREFGNVGVLKEQSRDARGGRWIHETASDIRYGVRGLIRTPLFTVVALTSLVLGIGLNTALFTMVEAAFNPSTAVDPSTLVDVRVRWSYPAFSYVRGRIPALVDVFARSTERVAVVGSSPAELPVRATAELVTPEFFVALRTPPQFGRVAVGGLVGIVGGAAASRVLGALLFGMSPLDPSAYAGAGALLAVVAVLACYVPARRATRVDPLVALRQE